MPPARRPIPAGLSLLAAASMMLAAPLAASAQDRTPPADLFPSQLTDFQPHPANPLFTGRGAGHWDVKIRERGWILKEGDRYSLWYTGYDGTREGLKMLGLARSTDGVHWTRVGEQPLYREHWVEDMMVVVHDGVYYMFAEGRGDQAQLLTSRDGETWRREGSLDVRRVGGERIPDGPYGTPTALFHDGQWNLFYERRDAGIWLARSADLKVWTNVSEEPVLRPGPEAYDAKYVAVNQIVPYRGRFYAYYHGSGESDQPQRYWCTCLAVSDDLIHWTKYPGNPLLPLEANKSSGILAPAPDGRLRLYTMHDAVHLHEPVRQ